MSVFCRASLNYVPRSQAGADGGDGAVGADGRSPVDVDILDGREANLPGWEECGFELMSHTSAVTDWTDGEEIAAVHYAEMEELARKLTHADIALVSSHIARSPEEAKRHFQFSPITFVHSDFAEGYEAIIRRSYREARDHGAQALARNQATPDTVDGAGRLVILQFWRNLGPARMDYPIAFCDARTVSRAQARAFRVSNYAGSGVDFDALAVTRPENPAEHAWYTFPELGRDEVVAFRTFDTDLVKTGQTFFTPHSAFRDPTVPVGRPSRWSIELRAACLFL